VKWRCPKGACYGKGMSDSTLLTIRRYNHNIADATHCLHQSMNTGGIDAVIVCNENVHPQSPLSREIEIQHKRHQHQQQSYADLLDTDLEGRWQFATDDRFNADKHKVSTVESGKRQKVHHAQ